MLTDYTGDFKHKAEYTLPHASLTNIRLHKSHVNIVHLLMFSSSLTPPFVPLPQTNILKKNDKLPSNMY